MSESTNSVEGLSPQYSLPAATALIRADIVDLEKLESRARRGFGRACLLAATFLIAPLGPFLAMMAGTRSVFIASLLGGSIFLPVLTEPMLVIAKRRWDTYAAAKEATQDRRSDLQLATRQATLSDLLE
jgi:hypothetical protein